MCKYDTFVYFKKVVMVPLPFIYIFPSKKAIISYSHSHKYTSKPKMLFSYSKNDKILRNDLRRIPSLWVLFERLEGNYHATCFLA
jgi:hypothetical protein